MMHTTLTVFIIQERGEGHDGSMLEVSRVSTASQRAGVAGNIAADLDRARWIGAGGVWLSGDSEVC